MSLDFTRLRLDNASQRVNRLIDDNIVLWTEQEIADKIRNTARSLGLSERVINAITVEKTGFMKADLVFDLRGPKDEPLDEFLENGFAAHDIEAKGKESGGAESLSWVNEFGNRVFRVRVHHPGFRGYHFMETGHRQNEPNLQRRIETEISDAMIKERLQ